MAAALDLDHVALAVHDARASLAFYRDVLGLTLVSALSGDDWGGYPWLMMIFDDGNGRQLALTALAGAPRPPAPAVKDVVHYGFAVDSLASLAAWKGRLRAAAVAFTEEDHGGGQQSVYFTDPDGTTLEITLRPRGAPASDDAAAVVERFLAKRDA